MVGLHPSISVHASFGIEGPSHALEPLLYLAMAEGFDQLFCEDGHVGSIQKSNKGAYTLFFHTAHAYATISIRSPRESYSSCPGIKIASPALALRPVQSIEKASRKLIPACPDPHTHLSHGRI